MPRYDFQARASEIDPWAREHPEIGFVFGDGNTVTGGEGGARASGDPPDMQYAAVDTSVPSRGELVIWLSNPEEPRRELFDRVVAYGCHVIKVHYANHWFGLIPDAVRNDGVSLGQIRLEAAIGADCGCSLVSIPKPDGMVERARQFLMWLTAQHPEGSWSQFLNADQSALRWADCITLAGSSHGSTTAARFATHTEVARVCLFCGPNARGQEIGPTGFRSATSSERFFVFSHTLDDTWPEREYPAVPKSWELLGLEEYGGLVNVDVAEPPYGGSRMLITSCDVTSGTDTAAMVGHCAVVPGHREIRGATGFVDATRRDEYTFEDCWRYMFTYPTSSAKGHPLAAKL
eukprot:COSAG02_NODE_5550_length_4236_cov_4.498671_3_plen_347_part_00